MGSSYRVDLTLRSQLRERRVERPGQLQHLQPRQLGPVQVVQVRAHQRHALQAPPGALDELPDEGLRPAAAGVVRRRLLGEA